MKLLLQYNTYIHIKIILIIFGNQYTIGDPIIETVRVGIPLTDLTPSQLYVCPKPENEFPMSYHMSQSIFVQ
jgi:hypothetical protein